MLLSKIFNILSLFKKKQQNKCFFCKIDLNKSKIYTLQYTSSEGMHSQKICEDCAKVFNELIDTMEEPFGKHTNTF
jgi:hypothetical protein